MEDKLKIADRGENAVEQLDQTVPSESSSFEMGQANTNINNTVKNFPPSIRKGDHSTASDVCAAGDDATVVTSSSGSLSTMFSLPLWIQKQSILIGLSCAIIFPGQKFHWQQTLKLGLQDIDSMKITNLGPKISHQQRFFGIPS